MGIYNFTRNKEGILYLLDHPNSYRDVAHIHQLGIPVMVNSDCHYPDLVNDGRTQAFQLLKEAGFTTTRELVNGHWEDLPID